MAGWIVYGCGAKSEPGKPLPGPTETAQPGGWAGPGLAELDGIGAPGVTHSAEASSTIVVPADEYFDCSANAEADAIAHTLRLPSGVQTASWAIYRFDGVTDNHAPFVVELDQLPPLTERFYLGVSDYARGSWRWVQVDQALGTYSYTVPLEYALCSPAGAAYIAVVTHGGVEALLNQLRLKLEQAQRGNWWMLGGNAQHTGRAQNASCQSLTLKWEMQLGLNSLYGPVEGADGTLYVVNTDGTVFAVSPQGAIVWTTAALDFARCFCSPAIGPDGTIYVATRYAGLYAVDRQGAHQWSANLGNASFSSPAIAPNGTVYVLDEAALYAITPTGALKWTFPVAGALRCSPALAADGTVYVTDPHNTLYAINPSGSLVWSYSPTGVTDRYYASSPSVDANGTVYFGVDEGVHGTLCAVSPLGALLWDYKCYYQDLQDAPAIALNGTVYFTGDDLIALTPQGELVWSKGYGQNPSSIAIGADGLVSFVSSEDVQVFRPDGSIVSEYQTSYGLSAGPMLSSNGDLIVCSTDGVLYAYGSGGTSGISGTLSKLEGGVVADVSVTLTGGRSISLPSLDDGSYIFSGLQDGQYVVTPMQDGWQFSPTSRTITIVGSSVAAVDFVGSATPVAQVSATPLGGDLPLLVTFDASASDDPDGGGIVLYEWDWENNGTYDLSSDTSTVNHTYDVRGSYKVGLRVTDNEGATAGTYIWIGAGRSPWPMFGHDPQRTHASPVIACQTGKLKWAYDSGTYILESPVLGVDGTVYFVNNDSNLFALDPQGNLRWRKLGDWSGNPFHNTPAVGADGTVYAGQALAAFEPDGTLKWVNDVGVGISAWPIVAHNGLIYATGFREIQAVDANGSVLWTYTASKDAWNAAAMGFDGSLYWGNDDNQVLALTTDGELDWSFPTSSLSRTGTAVGADGVVYAGDWSGYLYAINPDGSPRWSYFASSSGIESAVAISPSGTILIGDWNGTLHAVNPDGTRKWTALNAGSFISSPAIGADGTTYIGCCAGIVYAVGADGHVKWQYQTGDPVQSSPAIGLDGTVYVGSLDGKLYAFGDE